MPLISFLSLYLFGWQLVWLGVAVIVYLLLTSKWFGEFVSVKVALFLDEPAKGNRRHHIQLKALAEAGFDPKVVVLSGDPSNSYLAHKGHLSRFVSLGLSREKAFKSFSFKVVRRLNQIIRQERIGLIYTHRYRLLRYLLLCKIFNPGLKVVFYSVISGNFRSANRRLFLLLYKSWIDLFLVNSQALKEEFLSLGIPASRLEILYSAVDPEEFELPYSRAEARRLLGLPEEDFLWGMVARFRKEKDHEGLVQAFKGFLERGGQGRLVLVGDGPRENEIKRLVRDLGLSEKVLFLGRLPKEKIPVVLQALNVFVHPTFREGMPMAVMEAMAAGLPIIATDAEGLPDLFDTPRKFGFLIPKGDPYKLTEAMLSCLKLSEKEREYMGKEARQRIREAFSPEILSRRTVEIVQQVLKV